MSFIGDAMSAYGSWERKRILNMYSQRQNGLVNGTATGAMVVIAPMESEGALAEVFKSFNQDGVLSVTQFAPTSQPIRTAPYESGGLKQSLTGKVYGYNKREPYSIELAVIGNSPDYYRLKALQMFYIKYAEGNVAKGESGVPLLSMRMLFASAPGLEISFTNGLVKAGNVGVSITSDPRFVDDFFTFQFGDLPNASMYGKQYTAVNLLEGLLGGI